MLDNFLTLANYLSDKPNLRQLTNRTCWNNLLIVELQSEYLKESEENDEYNYGKLIYKLIKKLFQIQGVEHPDTEEYTIKRMFAVISNPPASAKGKSIGVKLYIPNPKKILVEELKSQKDQKSNSDTEVIHEDILKTELEDYNAALHEEINHSSGLPPFKIVDTHISNL
jgi:hypothetical protein